MTFRGWILYGSIFPRIFSCFYPVSGITLWPFICLRQTHEELHSSGRPVAQFINHEQIHIAQATEMCCIFMYILWVYDFVRGLMCISKRGFKCCVCRCDARVSYVWNRLEQEAFDHQHDMSYLERRPFCAWCSYPIAEIARQWLGKMGRLSRDSDSGSEDSSIELEEP